MTFQIRPQEFEDDASVVEVLAECTPLFPRPSVDDYRFEVAEGEKANLINRRFVAVKGATVIGAADVVQEDPDESGLFFVSVSVRPAEQGKGVGSALTGEITALKDELSYGRTVVWVEEREEYVAFARKFGFAPDGAGEQLSRLHVPTANLTGFEGVESLLFHQRISIDLLGDRVHDLDFMRQLHAVDMSAHRDIPSTVAWKDSDLDRWLRVIVTGPGRSPDWCWVALADGVPIGLARLRIYANRKAGNAFTGVLSSHRGKGIARALKFRTIEWSIRNGVEYIYTGNEFRNERMLAINKSLGYEPLPRYIEMERHW